MRDNKIKCGVFFGSLLPLRLEVFCWDGFRLILFRTTRTHCYYGGECRCNEIVRKLLRAGQWRCGWLKSSNVQTAD